MDPKIFILVQEIVVFQIFRAFQDSRVDRLFLLFSCDPNKQHGNHTRYILAVKGGFFIV